MNIKLTNSELTFIIDDEDYERVSKFNWQLLIRDNKFHGIMSTTLPYFRLARFILHVSKGSGTCVDHINRDILDNRKINLRIVTYAQNNFNRGLLKNNSSGYTGISFHKRKRKWLASIRQNYKQIHLGSFSSKEEAIKIRELKAKELYGEFCPK